VPASTTPVAVAATRGATGLEFTIQDTAQRGAGRALTAHREAVGRRAVPAGHLQDAGIGRRPAARGPDVTLRRRRVNAGSSTLQPAVASLAPPNGRGRDADGRLIA
jgi:hypothetical protein